MAFASRLDPGTVFARDFRVESPLSEGGMGAVYVVEQLSTGRRRALKVMHPSVVADPRHRERFAQEARIGSQIESDHVVEIVAAGIDDATGTPYLVMELLEGQDLAALAARGPVAPARVMDILEQLGDALGKAHARGIIHRDLKPENVFLATARRQGAPDTVKILDFGIAAIVASGRSAATVTSAIGSPLWMAPEQATMGAHITPATDVYALGLIVFHLLTARYYWLAANAPDVSVPALLSEVLVHPLVAPTERAASIGAAALLPQGFDAWFGRCVHRTVAARFRDASEAVAALRPLLGSTPTHHGFVPADAPSPFGTVPSSPGTPAPGYAPWSTPPVAPTLFATSQPGYPPSHAASPQYGYGPTPAPPQRPTPARRGLIVGLALGAVALGASGIAVLALRKPSNAPGAPPGGPSPLAALQLPTARSNHLPPPPSAPRVVLRVARGEAGAVRVEPGSTATLQADVRTRDGVLADPDYASSIAAAARTLVDQAPDASSFVLLAEQDVPSAAVEAAVRAVDEAARSANPDGQGATFYVVLRGPTGDAVVPIAHAAGRDDGAPQYGRQGALCVMPTITLGADGTYVALAASSNSAGTAGPEGAMGRRDAPARSARYAIRNNGEPPHLSRQAARENLANRGIFAALGAPGGGTQPTGVISPFGRMDETGDVPWDQRSLLSAAGSCPAVPMQGTQHDRDGLLGVLRTATAQVPACERVVIRAAAATPWGESAHAIEDARVGLGAARVLFAATSAPLTCERGVRPSEVAPPAPPPPPPADAFGYGGLGAPSADAGAGSGAGYGADGNRDLRGRNTQGPLVRAAPPTVSGLLSPEAIRRVVLRNLGQIAHCHEQGLAQNPMLEGRVVIRFLIGGAGAVMGSSVAESSIGLPSVATCMATAVRRWQFPAPEGGGVVTVNYPFNLQHPE